MKRLLITVFLVLYTLFVTQLVMALEIKVDNRLGAASLHQEAGNVNSEWVGFFYEGLLSVGHYEEEGIIGGVEVGFPISSASEEEWDNRGQVGQKNDLSFWGVNSNLEIGYAFPTNIIGDLEIGVAPLVGYGLSFLKFERTNFNITNRVPGVAVVSEDYLYHHIDVGGKIIWYASDRITANLKTMVGFIVFNTNDNSQLGKITGGNGYIVKTQGGIDYLISSNLSLNLDGFVEVNGFQGTTDGAFTWLDGDFNVYGGKLGVKYIF